MASPNDPNYPDPQQPDPQGQSPSKGPGAEVPSDDASSQALSESLRSSFVIVKIIVFLLIGWFLTSLIFSVSSDERAVILRLGKAGSVLEPGYHWRLPFVDEVVRIPQGQVKSVRATNAWYAVDVAGNPLMSARAATLDPAAHGYTLTEDGNILHVRATLQYRITDAKAYAFNHVTASNTVAHFLNNALYYAASQFTAEEALWRDQAGFKQTVERRIRALMPQAEGAELGIELESTTIEKNPPLQIERSFTQLQDVTSRREQQISEAEGSASELLATARGEANRILSQAQSRTNEYLQSLSADAEYFQDVLPQYQSQPELLRTRLLVETTQNVLTNSRTKFIVTGREGGTPREVRIQLNRIPEPPGQTNRAQGR